MPMAGTVSPLEGMVRFNIGPSLAAAASDIHEDVPSSVDPASIEDRPMNWRRVDIANSPVVKPTKLLSLPCLAQPSRDERFAACGRRAISSATSAPAIDALR